MQRQRDAQPWERPWRSPQRSQEYPWRSGQGLANSLWLRTWSLRPEILLRPQPHHLQDMWLGLINFLTCFLLLLSLLETKPHCVAQAGLKMMVLLAELRLQEFLTTLWGLITSLCQNGPSYEGENPVLNSAVPCKHYKGVLTQVQVCQCAF